MGKKVYTANIKTIAEELFSPNSGWYYKSNFYFSEAYQSLALSARDLLQCFLCELRWDKPQKKRGKKYKNNGDIAFTQTQFSKLYRSKETYIKARNQLITVGFIKQTYPGGNGRSRPARYKLLFVEGVTLDEQRWRKYPAESWKDEIPSRENPIGKNTRWKPGKSGCRKDFFHPINVGAKNGNPPTKVDPKENNPPIKVDPLNNANNLIITDNKGTYTEKLEESDIL